MSLVRIDRSWSPVVRYAARRYRRDLKRAQREFERAISKGATEGEAMSVLCAKEAKAVIALLNRLGYGGDRKKAPARDRLELELRVHELDEDSSMNFFRAFLAQSKGKPLDQYFSRKGRKRTEEEAGELRRQHIAELTQALRARKAIWGWMSAYYGRFELPKKYREFTRVQFDEELEDEAKLTYLSLLIAQMADRAGRDREEVLQEYNAIAGSLNEDGGM